MADQGEDLAVTILSFIWKAPSSTSGIARARNHDKTLTITGPICQLPVGEEIQVHGKWVLHPKYGMQFRVSGSRGKEIQALLARLAAAGITSGPIVEQAKALQVGEAQAATWNPYYLLKFWPWLSWAEADRIALTDMGISDLRRMEAYLDWMLQNELADDAAGCWLPIEKAIPKAERSLNLPPSISSQLPAMSDVSSCLVPQPAIIRKVIFNAEDIVFNKVQVLKETGGPSVPCKDTQYQLSDGQYKACLIASQNGISAISGPPGTGKTRCLAEIYKVHEAAGIPTYLAAPTGKAAFRIQEVSGGHASTIHRLLRCQLVGRNRFQFALNNKNPIPGPACIILDEASMIPLELMAALMDAIPEGSRLVQIGDTNQIKPIEPGQPFIDLIESGAVVHNQLTQIWRNVEGSAIAEACRLVLAGEAHELFSFLRSEGAAAEIDYRAIQDDREIADFVRGFDCGQDSSIVLCPFNRGAAGSEVLNNIVQIVRFGTGQCFFRGDRVMQIRNDYHRADRRGIFNGDVGVVVGLHKGNLLVDFGGESPEGYKPEQASRDLRLAYAISIHKSQGSEWERVILAIPKEAGNFLTRQLLYTGLSRARRHLTILAHPWAIQKALGIQPPKARTRLGALLRPH